MDVCQHQPNRPFWDCTMCGDEWPCGPARARLLAEAEDSLSLAMQLWAFFEAYALDLGEGPVPEAFQDSRRLHE